MTRLTPPTAAEAAAFIGRREGSALHEGGVRAELYLTLSVAALPEGFELPVTHVTRTLQAGGAGDAGPSDALKIEI